MRNVNRPRQFEGCVFTRQQALRAGLTDKQLSGSEWRRLLRGVYADSGMKFDHGLRLAAASRILPRHAAIAGPSAAWVHGCTLASPEEPIHVLVPRSQLFGPIQSVRVHTSCHAILSGDVRPTQGRFVTSPLRTAWDLGCWMPLKHSVPYLDVMLRNGIISRESLVRSVQDRPSIRGSAAAFTAVRLADGRAESFAESSLRAQLHEAKLPEPEIQYVLRVDGVFVARLDFAWPTKRVALEYEGSYHATASQMPADRERLSRIAAAGWRVVFATGKHVYGSAMPELVETLRSILT